MMFQGKHIHYSAGDKKPLCSYSVKLCKQRRLKDYAFCIRHILEDKSAPFKQCAHVAKYNNQKCTNPIPSNEDRAFCNSHMQVEGFLPKVQKKDRKIKGKKEKELNVSSDGKVKFADRLRALLRNEECPLTLENPANSDDPYAFTDAGTDKHDDVLPNCFYQSRVLWNNSNSSSKFADNDQQLAPNKTEPLSQFSFQNDNHSNTGILHYQSASHLPSKTQFQVGALNTNSNSSTSSSCSNATPKSSGSSSGSGPSCESVSKAKPNNGNIANNNNGPKFTKTMNRLQAKIAQNKVLDKLKKSQLESSQNGPNKSLVNHIVSLPSKLAFTAVNIKKEVGLKTTPPSINGNHRELLNLNSLQQLPVSFQQMHQQAAIAKPTKSSKSSSSRSHSNKAVKKEPQIAASKPPQARLPLPFGLNRDQLSTTSSNPPIKNRTVKTVAFSSSPNLWPATSSVATFFPSNAASNCLPKNNLQVLNIPATIEIKAEPVVELAVVKEELPSPATARKREVIAELTQQSQKFSVKSRKREDYIYHGFICSDSEDSDEADDCVLLKRINWCSGLESNAPTWCSTKATTRQGKQQALKSEMRRYGQLANKALSIEECVLEHQLKMARNVVQATQLYPKTTAQLLFKKYPSKVKKKLTGVGLEKNICCYQSEKLNCTNLALPYTRHCIKHIMYNVDQLLFEHCTAKFADNTQCCVPVFDISHELPLCAEHAKKRDNYNKMASEPKPKKARKKTKPSALTRPPKRGKKKKRQTTSLRPSSLPPSPVDDSSCKFNSNSGATDINSDSVTFSTTREGERTNGEIPKGMVENMETELHDVELENHFSPGTIEKSLELPLDTAELARQATKLLEEHDFTEVLNKIPDDAFSDLFNDGRNGEYIPTKEETEELERALAAVSKDVNMAKESLAKLTVTRQDIEELSSNIALPSALIAAENLTSTLDANALNDMESLNVMTGLSTTDLSSLSQAFNEGLTSASHHSNLVTTHLTNRHQGSPHTSSIPVILESEVVPQHLRGTSLGSSLSSMLSSDSLAPHLTNGDLSTVTNPECLINHGTEFGLSSQFLENAINVYGAAAVAAGISHGVTASGDLLVGPPDPSILGGSLVSGQFVNQDGSGANIAMLGNGGNLLGGRQMNNLDPTTTTVSEDELLTLPSLAGCTPQWLLNSSSLALSQNVGYQNGFLTASANSLSPNLTLSQHLLSKFPLQALNAETVSLLSNHNNLAATSVETYPDNLNCTNLNLKDSVQGFLRPVTSTVNQQETKATMLAQEGAS